MRGNKEILVQCTLKVPSELIPFLKFENNTLAYRVRFRTIWEIEVNEVEGGLASVNFILRKFMLLRSEGSKVLLVFGKFFYFWLDVGGECRKLCLDSVLDEKDNYLEDFVWNYFWLRLFSSSWYGNWFFAVLLIFLDQEVGTCVRPFVSHSLLIFIVPDGFIMKKYEL